MMFRAVTHEVLVKVEGTILVYKLAGSSLGLSCAMLHAANTLMWDHMVIMIMLSTVSMSPWGISMCIVVCS